MHHRIVAAAAAASVLALPSAAGAHVTLHPNVVPAGAFARIALRVPNEQSSANTTAVSVKMPPGFVEVSADPPPGWSFSVKTAKLAKPVTTDDGVVTTQVTEVDFTGGRIGPGRFAEFPLSVAMPDKPGSILTFKTVQRYDNGVVARWIETEPDAESPAPTIGVSPANGPILDVAGPLTDAVKGAEAVGTQDAAQASDSGGASKGLGIAALVIGSLGLLAGVVALANRPPRHG